MKSTTRNGLVLVALVMPLVTFAQVAAQTTTGIRGVGEMIINLINTVLVPVLLALAFIVFIYGVVSKYIFSNGDEGKVSEGHKLILWGIIGFAVILSVWGLVNIVVDTFGLNLVPSPDTPKVGSPRATPAWPISI